MSRARPITPGARLLLTRRVRCRRFLLRPGRRTNRIVRYVVATMAKKHGLLIHAITALSNHWHLCLTDPHGNIVGFQHDCHQFISRAVNAHHGEFESMWASEPASRVECQEPGDLIVKIAYTMANPVEAGLVRYGRSWPGVRRAWPSEPLVVKRPPRFFRGEQAGGSWPDAAVLELTRPPGYDELSDDDLAAVIGEAIEQREAKLRNEHDAKPIAFLGRRKVLEQPRHGRPRTGEPRFGISPRVACKNKWRRIERLQANRQWQVDYRAALAGWRAGDREVVFPVGTYKMRLVHGAQCAEPPD